MTSPNDEMFLQCPGSRTGLLDLLLQRSELLCTEKLNQRDIQSVAELFDRHDNPKTWGVVGIIAVLGVLTSILFIFKNRRKY